jgi:hypothetical protein
MDRQSIQLLVQLVHESTVPLYVGRATIAWNTLSGAMFQSYQLLSELDEATAKATFFSITSDRSQRDIVANLVELKLRPLDPVIANRFKSVIGEANKLAGKRNDILHVVLVDDDSPDRVAQMHERGHLKDKAGADLIAAMHKFTMDCLDLASKAYRLYGEVRSLPHYHRLALAEALLRYTPERTPEELANQEGFGLLGPLATTDETPP